MIKVFDLIPTMVECETKDADGALFLGRPAIYAFALGLTICRAFDTENILLSLFLPVLLTGEAYTEPRVSGGVFVLQKQKHRTIDAFVV